MAELKKIELQNKGMSQDMSISKEGQEFAFENHNIRIQALNDSTLLSVTNIRGPKVVSRMVFVPEKQGTATVLFSQL